MRHHLSRVAVAAMAAAGVFGLGYWTGLPDPGAPKGLPALSGIVPAPLQLRLERDVDALGKRLTAESAANMKQ